MAHPRIERVECLGPRCYVHYFKLEQSSDLDSALIRCFRKAYAVGRREHVGGSEPDRPQA
ncbi:MAG: hypothetical protein JNJ88_15810 [Planctomycetes bacterium]|nr:hypothetical protein [Planctomycetota bacterium]